MRPHGLGSLTGTRGTQTRSFAVLAMLLAVLTAVSSVFGLGAQRSGASSHREAPIISQDPAADNTDVYAFVSPDAPATVTLIANYYPFQDPAGGPNFYRFGDDVLYDIHIDADADAVADLTYRFEFSTDVQNPDTFLYNTGPIDSLDDEDWNVRQFYSITEIRGDDEDQLEVEGVVPPVNIGPASTPDYDDLATDAIVDAGDGLLAFAGQRDDPFFVDLGGIFDLLTIRQPPGNAGGGVDDLACTNVQTIAIQVPIEDLTADGSAPSDPEDASAVIGVWATASRFSTTIIDTDGSRSGSGDPVQVSRLGMPLVNEVVVPLGAKDLWNGSVPEDDAQFLEGVTDPELPGLLNALYGIDVPEGDRDDLVQVFLTGVPGLNQPPDVVPSEMIRLNVAIPPADAPDPLGVLAGDTAGFPNGRRLADDVVDIELRVVAGVLAGDEFAGAPNNQLGDGVDANDVEFLDEFPYVAPPRSGFDAQAPGCDGLQDAATPPPSTPDTDETEAPTGDPTDEPTTAPTE
ncbi:MAG: hypothetical protein AVDCRST_MAG73-1086, partial [uncultured Thermomicrobiales bacterium]